MTTMARQIPAVTRSICIKVENLLHEVAVSSRRRSARFTYVMTLSLLIALMILPPASSPVLRRVLHPSPCPSIMRI